MGFCRGHGTVTTFWWDSKLFHCLRHFPGIGTSKHVKFIQFLYSLFWNVNFQHILISKTKYTDFMCIYHQTPQLIPRQPVFLETWPTLSPQAPHLLVRPLPPPGESPTPLPASARQLIPCLRTNCPEISRPPSWAPPFADLLLNPPIPQSSLSLPH